MSGDTLAAPGHPPVSLGQIRRIDRRQWDRKGIAYVHYDAPGFPQGQIKLDDFVYDRPPIDQIFERVERAVSAGAAPQSVPRRR